MRTLSSLGEEFVKRHQIVFDLAKLCGVAICGGCAAAIVKNNVKYEPPDIDLVGTHGKNRNYLLWRPYRVANDRQKRFLGS